METKKFYYQILRKAFRMYCDREKYAYVYGAKGEIMTETLFEDFVKMYPGFYGKYSRQELNEFKRYSIGKVCYDCSGFITAITGKQGYSGKLYEDTVNKTSVENGKCGYLLWKPGHVGIDIGYGFSISCGRMGSSFEIAKIQDVGYTKSGAFAGYDYTDATNH